MKITNSKMKTWQRCKRQFHYKFGREIVRSTVGLPLKRGSWLHELLEAHYSGEGWEKRHAKLSKEFAGLFDEEKELYGDLPVICGNIMKAYEYNYRKEDKGLKVLATELEIEVPLPHGHVLGGQIDMVAEDEFGVWMWEHKSHAKVPRADYRFIDAQSAKYVWALNKMGDFGEILGICWNYLLTKVPTVPKLNQDGTLSKRKIKTDLFTYVKALKSYGVDLHDYRDVILRLKQRNDFFRRDRVPYHKKIVETLVKDAVRVADEIEKGYIPVRSISRDCEYNCPYLDICVVELYGGDVKDIVKSKYRPAKEGDYGYEEKAEVA